MVLACPSIVSAKESPIEISLEEIYVEYEWVGADDDELTKRTALKEILEFFKVEFEPELGRGDASQKRVLKSCLQESSPSILRQIAEGETDTCEFKSSLCFDRKKFAADGKLAPQDYQSSKVIIASLKSIAGFLNTNGGRLLIGIADDGSATGIEDDLWCNPNAKNDFDGFDLYLRSLIARYFVDPDAVNAYVKLQRIMIGGKTVCVCSVAARSELTFMRVEDRCRLYIRRGTSTSEVPYERIEQYYKIERMF